MRLQRVLMSADAVGGVWNYALDLAEGLSRHGVLTLLAVLGPAPTPAQTDAARRIHGLRLEHGDYALEWMQGGSDAQAAAGAWLLQLARNFAPDVVHLNHYAHGHLDWPAPALVVAHSCVLSWHEHVRGEPAAKAWLPYQQAVQRGLDGADRVVAPTRAMLADLQRLYDAATESRVIHNGRDPADYFCRPKRDRVLAAGRLWDEGKNLGALAQAAPQVSWPVCIAGDAAHPDGGRASLEHVDLLGVLPHEAMAQAMGEAAIYALPARYEPFGLSILEAALSGCVLVLGNIGSLRELWQDAAEFVDPNDPAALAEHLNVLIDDPPRRQHLARAARSRAEHYSRRRMVDDYLTAYGELTEKTKAAPCMS